MLGDDVSQLFLSSMKLFIYFLVQSIFLFQNAYAQKSFEKDIEVGDAYFKISEYDNAIYYYESAFDKEPSASLCNKIAKSYMLKHDYQSAEKWYAALTSSYEHSAKDILNYALALKCNSNYEEAKVNLNNYLDQNPNDSLEIAMQIASCDSSILWNKKSSRCLVRNVEKINSEYSDIAPAFYKDDIVFCSTREGTIIKNKEGSSGQPFYNLYSSKNGRLHQWHTPKIFSTDLNTKDHEGPVTFNFDYSEVYLTRCEAKQTTESSANKLKLFKSEKGTLGWSAPESFMFDDSISSFAHPCISKNGKLFFFASDKPGGFGGSDIYVSFKLDSNLWSKPINLGPAVNTKDNELYPYFYEEEGMLYFSSDGHIGMGGFDIFSAELDGKNWVNITNLKPPINSSYDDFSFVMDDKKYQGFFTSNRTGGKGKEDIYVVIFNY